MHKILLHREMNYASLKIDKLSIIICLSRGIDHELRIFLFEGCLQSHQCFLISH